jgi:hypothetical protein
LKSLTNHHAKDGITGDKTMISYTRIYEKKGFSIDIAISDGKPAKWILKKVRGAAVYRLATFDFLEAAKAALEQAVSHNVDTH